MRNLSVQIIGDMKDTVQINDIYQDGSKIYIRYGEQEDMTLNVET